MDVHNQIKDISLFQGVSSEKIRLLASQGIYKKFKPGEMVIGEDELMQSFYVVISGQRKSVNNLH